MSVEKLESFILYVICFVYSIVMSRVLQKYDCKYKFTWGGKKIKYIVLQGVMTTIVCFIPIILIYGLRGINVGNDTISYSQYYDLFKDYVFGEINTSFVEPAYVLINIVASKVFGTEVAVHLICGFIIFFVLKKIMYCYKCEIDYGICVLIFMMTGYVICCNQVRQMIAVLIVLYGFRYVEKRKLLKYFIAIFIAMTFHKSAILTIVIYPIYHLINEKNKWKFRGVICITPIILIVLFDKIVEKLLTLFGYTIYLNRFGEIDYGELTCLLYVIPEILLVLYLEKNQCVGVKQKRNSMLINIYLVSFVFQFCQVFWNDLVRLSYYFAFFRIILVPLLLKNQSMGKRKISCWMSIAWYIIVYLVLYFILNGHGTYPYTFYFQ